MIQLKILRHPAIRFRLSKQQNPVIFKRDETVICFDESRFYNNGWCIIKSAKFRVQGLDTDAISQSILNSIVKWLTIQFENFQASRIEN